MNGAELAPTSNSVFIGVCHYYPMKNLLLEISKFGSPKTYA
jgi:hypothetical protein